MASSFPPIEASFGEYYPERFKMPFNFYGLHYHFRHFYFQFVQQIILLEVKSQVSARFFLKGDLAG